MRPAGDQDDLVTALEQPGADRAADGPCPDDDVAHGPGAWHAGPVRRTGGRPAPRVRPAASAPPRPPRPRYAQSWLAVTGLRPALPRPSRMVGSASIVHWCPMCSATTEPGRTAVSTRRCRVSALGSL